MRDWMFCSATSASAGQLGERALQHLEVRGVRRLDRDDDEADAQVVRESLRVGDAALGRVARRHADADDVLGAEGVDGDRGDDAGVDAAGQRDERLLEAGLAEVVARAEDERAVDLGFVREFRFDARLHRGTIGRHVGWDDDVPHLAGVFFAELLAAEARVVQPRAEQRFRADVVDEQVFFEHLRAGQQLAVRADDHRAAIEDELVLAADLVRVADEDAVVARAAGQHLLAELACPRGRASR